MTSNRAALLMTILGAGAAIAACHGGTDSELMAAPPDSTEPAPSGIAHSKGVPDDGDAGGERSGGGLGTGADTGLPCDVEQLLENRCMACHDKGPSPPRLLSYADLLEPATSDPKKTLAQVSLERMKSTTDPMPPKPAMPADDDEIAAMEAWVTSGTKKGPACTSAGPVDADAGTGAEGKQGKKDRAQGVVCSSNKRWNGGDDGSPSMHPGGTCITCHAALGGPAFKAAGTVYPTLHEPNDCDGLGGVSIVITDADGRTTTVNANAAGNFFTNAKIKAPFSVKVVSGGKNGGVRAMLGTLTAGDCNSCHTEDGANGAPGRIMAP